MPVFWMMQVVAETHVAMALAVIVLVMSVLLHTTML